MSTKTPTRSTSSVPLTNSFTSKLCTVSKTNIGNSVTPVWSATSSITTCKIRNLPSTSFKNLRQHPATTASKNWTIVCSKSTNHPRQPTERIVRMIVARKVRIWVFGLTSEISLTTQSDPDLKRSYINIGACRGSSMAGSRRMWLPWIWGYQAIGVWMWEVSGGKWLIWWGKGEVSNWPLPWFCAILFFKFGTIC